MNVSKKIIARLIEAFAEELDLDLNGYGSATFRKEAPPVAWNPMSAIAWGNCTMFLNIALEIVLTSGGIDKSSRFTRV